MPSTLTITNLRGIRRLEFDIPGQGVHLLAGANGTGKTSVLACLRRIGDSNAFPRHFSSGVYANNIDSTAGAAVRYDMHGSTVTYAYGGTRWVPTPRSQAGLLRRAGYSRVIYLGATAERITPTPSEFGVHRARPAPQAIKDAVNRVFQTQRFADLRQMRLAPRGGSGPVAFLVPVGQTNRQAAYSTEKSFSLGELCVLKLVRELESCSNSALVLIDELELALHPMAQVRLLEYVESVAQQKNLTVIFSTHSVTLLKRAKRHQLLLLERQGDDVTCVAGCYPTYALGAIAFEEEMHPDAVIYVEDTAAAQVTEALVQLALATRFAGRAHLQPSYRIVPVGGFMEVVRFLPRGGALLPTRVTAHALLDADVQTETIAEWRNTGNHAALAEFQQAGNRIRFLPWTPEVGLIEYLQAHSGDAQETLRRTLGNNQLRIDPHQFPALPPAGGPRRDACKRIVDTLAQGIAASTVDRTTEDVTRVLYQQLAKFYFDMNRHQAMRLIAPLVVV